MNLTPNVSAIVHLCAFFIAFILSCATVNAQAAILFDGRFESGRINTNGTTPDGYLVQTYDGSSYVGVTSGGAGPSSGYDTRVVASESVGGDTVTPRDGAYFIRSEIIKSKDYTAYSGNGGLDKPRSNIAMSASNFRTNFDEENWVGFSVYLPSNFEHEVGTKGRNNSIQIYTQYATTTQATQFALVSYVPTGETVTKWFIEYFVDATSTTESYLVRQDVDLGVVTDDLGKWTDFVIRYRINPFTTATNASTITNGKNQTYQGNKGILQVWKASGAVDSNGNRTMTRVLNIENAPVGLVPHTSNLLVNALRIYKYAWKTQPTSVVGPIWMGFDEVRAGKALSGVSYDDVAPASAACTTGCPTDPTGPTITATNQGNPIPENTPATAIDTPIFFTTSGDTNGVMGVSLTDGVNTVQSQLFNSNNTGGGYNTGSLSALVGNSAILQVTYDKDNLVVDTEGAQSFDTYWALDGVTRTALYADPLHVAPSTSDRNTNAQYLKGYTIANSTTGFKAISTPEFASIVDGTNYRLQCAFRAGSTGKVRVRVGKRVDSTYTYNIISGTLGSSAVSTQDVGTGHAFSKWDDNGVYVLDYDFTTSGGTGNYFFSIGPDGNATNDSVIALGCRIWKNAAPITMTYNVQLDRPDSVAPSPGPCDFIKNGNAASISCLLDDPTGEVCAVVTDSVTSPSATYVKESKNAAGTAPLWGACGTVNGLTYATTTAPMDPYKDWYLFVVHTDPSSNDSAVVAAETHITGETPVTKAVKFNATHGRLKRGGALFSGTFGNLKIYSELPWKDPAATLLAHAQEVVSTSGEVTVVESDLEPGGSINALISSTDYAFVAYDDDDDPFAFGYIQITVE